ncbi:Integrator complex subunit 11 [Entomortierella chlamydospora]|uniref:Integrator complex subunit 11 n=1 Tax=Entomortierella chlamydospora TaxID=101097 RepID=A0A9P6T4L0_9FUNG|nr:Integrator complex subunit 11 [Entomortierella chlamydospora]KAG0024458.1 Integrator complex subunit 11 [Entomortierella chlamydospora]
MTIQIVPLGAGQDVGRSCILVTIGGKNIMLDCGMHMGFNDERRFPDFSYISKTGDFTEMLDCVIISHFHLDHCGALPFFTEMCGYDGNIYMTHPTKAICPILLEDYRKISVDRKGERNFFTSQNIKDCMKKVIAVNLHQTIMVDDDLEICAYYAGHVLGAAMFYIRVGEESLVYTGDYNMTPDRHLGSAWIDKVRPDVLITESTYATTIRDSKRSRERDFLKKVHDCVAGGGNVIIPVFALGRAQELCILIETYWERMDLKVPIYFSAGLTEKANHFYRLFINWTNEKIKSTFVHRNMFDFKHIKAWDRSYIDATGPMVVFATPGMLHSGTSLELFKKWAPDPKNMVIMPGYCVAGTVGSKVLAGEKKIQIDAFTSVDVNLQVKNLSFSAHADAKGIMQLIRQCEAKNVVLVHGEKSSMGFLKSRIMTEFGIPCFDPANGTTVSIETSHVIPIEMSASLLKQHLIRQSEITDQSNEGLTSSSSLGDSSDDSLESINLKKPLTVKPKDKVLIQGMLVMEDGKPIRLEDAEEALDRLGTAKHKVRFEVRKAYNATALRLAVEEADYYKKIIKSEDERAMNTDGGMDDLYKDWDGDAFALDLVFVALQKSIGSHIKIARENGSIVVRSVKIRAPTDEDEFERGGLLVGWDYQDEDLATRILSVVTLTLAANR